MNMSTQARQSPEGRPGKPLTAALFESCSTLSTALTGNNGLLVVFAVSHAYQNECGLYPMVGS
jgi:hypothetical protein